MWNENGHPTDEELLLAADGELASGSAKALRAHLSACWHCRARMAELEAAIVEFARVHHETLDAELPPIDPSRTRLSARLSAVSGKAQASSSGAFFQFMSGRYAMAALGCGLLAASWLVVLLIRQPLRSFWPGQVAMGVASPVEEGVEPNPKLTPGAIRQVSMREMCAVPHEEVEVDVPDGLREKILHAYGIPEKRKSDYEIDFLIAPRLGGTEDPQNLWPEPYAPPVWNARVKDELEERLHELVCSGEVDLKTAQNDISADWIGAYKKYFNSDKPVSLSGSGGTREMDSRCLPQNRWAKMWPTEGEMRFICQTLVRDCFLRGRVT